MTRVPRVRGLIGHTGYVGTTLRGQTEFDAGFRSSTIGEIKGRHFDLLVCAGAPAAKWRANTDPAGDAASVDALIAHLDTVTANDFVLISTVDVFGDPYGVDESTKVDTAGLHPYGANRRRLEQFCADKFINALVVRLPGLVGPGLRKNVIHDLRHGNALEAVDSRGVFQFYPMVNLWTDVATAIGANLSLVHLTAQPLQVAEVAAEGFGREFGNELDGPVARYDFRTTYAGLFGGVGAYQYSRRESMLAIRAYAQSEPTTVSLSSVEASGTARSARTAPSSPAR